MKDQKTQINEEKKEEQLSNGEGTEQFLDDDDVDEELISEEDRKEHLYHKANKRMGFAPHMYRREDQADMYRQAAELFGQIPGYEQADELRKECLTQADIHRKLYIKETAELAQKAVSEASNLYSCNRAQNFIDAIAGECDLSALQQQLDGKVQKQMRKIKRISFLKKLAIVVVLLAIIIVIFYIKEEMGVSIAMPA